MYFAICNVLNSLSPCPITAFNVSPGFQFFPDFLALSLLANTPDVSLGNSIPVFDPNPKYLANFARLSIPILSPAS